MSGWDLLTQGNIIGSILQPYSELIGLENFYLIIIMIACGLLYTKSRSIGLVGLTLMLTGIAILPFTNPAMSKYFFAIILVGFVSIVYSAFKVW